MKDSQKPRPFIANGTIEKCAAVLSLAALIASLSAAGAMAQNSSIQKPEPVTIQGTVRNSAGEPVMSATVLAREQNSTDRAEAKTSADGAFSLTVGHTGTYLIRAEKKELQSRNILVTLSVGEKKQLDFIIDAANSGPVPSSVSSQSPRSSPGLAPIEFDDKPNFTVAGVTDWSNAGTHGSDIRARTSEALTKETVALKSSESVENSAGASESAEKAEAHRLRAETKERTGDSLGAVREYEQAALLNPSERNYFEWGTELLVHKAAVPAAEVFTKGSAKYPNSSRMLAALGTALYAAGSYDDAARRLCEASDLRPSDPAAYLLLGTMEKASAASLPCSEPRLARFARQQPESALANYYYAVALWKKARGSTDAATFREVEARLQKAVAIDPKFGEAYVQLGIAEADRGDTNKAIQAYTKAIEVSPRLGEAHYGLSLAYKRMGEETKAHQEFQTYEQIQKTEAAAIDREHRELRQFLIILKNEPASP